MNGWTCWLLVAALASSGEACAIGSLAEVTIRDRDTGCPLTPHYYRGEYWVAGRPGARYAIEIHNHSGGRILAVTAVDGVNVLSGETAGWDQTGYVFAADEAYDLTGWRKSDREVADFTFTDRSDSYAALTGRPANVGVIGLAVFEERRMPLGFEARPFVPAEPAPLLRIGPMLGAPGSTAGAAVPIPGAPGPTAGAAVPIPGAPGSRAGAAVPIPGAPSAGAPSAIPSPPAAPDAALASPVPLREVAPQLGTGHGEREYSLVTHTDFAREQPAPNEVIRFRYDSYDNLVAMGVLAAARRDPRRAKPFPESSEPPYVPDPPG